MTTISDVIAERLECAQTDADIIAIFDEIGNGFGDSKKNRDLAFAVFKLYHDCFSLSIAARAFLSARSLIANDPELARLDVLGAPTPAANKMPTKEVLGFNCTKVTAKRYKGTD